MTLHAAPPDRPTLVAQPLTAANFAPFGTVLEAPRHGGRWINGGSSERFDLVEDLQLGAAGGHAQLALFRASAQTYPIAIREVECHRLGSQTFVPWGHRRFVVVVAPAGGPPAADALKAFVTDGHQGVVLAPGTWHHGLLALDAGDFLVIERAAPVVDCDLHPLPAPLWVSGVSG